MYALVSKTLCSIPENNWKIFLYIYWIYCLFYNSKSVFFHRFAVCNLNWISSTAFLPVFRLCLSDHKVSSLGVNIKLFKTHSKMYDTEESGDEWSPLHTRAFRMLVSLIWWLSLFNFNSFKAFVFDDLLWLGCIKTRGFLTHLLICLTYFWPIFRFYIPWKLQKTVSYRNQLFVLRSKTNMKCGVLFLVFSGGVKWEYSPEMS